MVGVNPALFSLLPFIMGMPIGKHLEAACKEASKKIEKRAKSLPMKKLTKKVLEEVICVEAGKLDKTLTKEAAGVLKSKIETEKKKVEAEIKKKDPAAADTEKLNKAQDDLLKLRKERDPLDHGKPMAVPKITGDVIMRSLQVPVVTKDNVEVHIGVEMAIDRKKLLNEGKVQVMYGGVFIGGRF